LRREEIRVSTSTVGRVMKRLKERGVLVEPLNVRVAREARKRRRKPRYAIRKPQGYRVTAPGDLVQVDTLQIRLQSDDRRWQFSPGRGEGSADLSLALPVRKPPVEIPVLEIFLK
jgi:putative transposase